MPVAAVDQQILAAAADCPHGSAGQREHVARHRPAQARLAHRHAADHAAGELRREAAARNFDFGQFRHGEKHACAGHQIYLR
jgi:hypothetical protein